jgi:hypothetical protein
MKLNQKEAVFQAAMSVLKDSNLELEPGHSITEIVTKDMRSSICEIVSEGFRTGSIEFRDTSSNQTKLQDRAQLSSYVSGLVNNWFRKDKRLNGGNAYVAKNPGSRTGSGDAQLKALKALSKQFHGTEKAALIQVEIDKRTAELAASKAKKVEVDMTQVPEELKSVLGIE